MRALCKISGMLVTAELKKADGQGECPICKGTEFAKHQGWVECIGCRDYAILERNYEDFKNIKRQRRLF